jgi:hypothetical protein
LAGNDQFSQSFWACVIIIIPFPSALQLRMGFGLLNNLPPFFSILYQLGLPIFLAVYILF